MILVVPIQEFQSEGCVLQAKEEEQQAASADAVFPVILQIMENCIFNAKDPIVLGCTVEEGIAKVSMARSLASNLSPQ